MRKIFTIGILGLGFWLGIKTAGFLQENRCVAAGGTLGPTNVCIGAQ